MSRPAILFDLDGTLSDPKDGITRSIRHALDELHQPLDPSTSLEWVIGPPLKDSLARLLPGREHLAAEALRLYRQRYETVGLFENALYPRVPEALGDLAKRARLFVATSKLAEFAASICRHFGIDGYFEKVYGSRPDGTFDDKAELLGHILKEKGLAPENCLMIGDTRFDILAAKAHGIAALGVLWGYGSREELLAAGAEGLVERPGGLAGKVASLPTGSGASRG